MKFIYIVFVGMLFCKGMETFEALQQKYQPFWGIERGLVEVDEVSEDLMGQKFDEFTEEAFQADERVLQNLIQQKRNNELGEVALHDLQTFSLFLIALKGGWEDSAEIDSFG